MRCIFELIFLGLMTSLVLADECPYQKCDCEETQILCNYRDFKVMPQKLFNGSPNLTSLDLDGNQITTIPAGSLPANMSIISMQDNPIESIDDTAFDESIYTLQEIYFASAQLKQFPPAIFQLKTLKLLQIGQTNILIWNEDGMNRLGPTMNSLSLTTVGLTSWPTWMKSMTNLTTLVISGCSITTIPDDALDTMANSLTSLELSSNGLTKLPKSMSKLTKLKSMDLSYNRIVDITSIPHSGHLKTLYLGSNKITDAEQVSNVLRECANTISNFDITNNTLTSIPELSFLTHISILNFHFNHLVDANSGSFPANITELDFGSNLLSSIPTAIQNLNHLTELFLNSNNIQFVQGNQIPTSVQILDLGFNSISQLFQSSFHTNLNLIILTLDNNPLSTISPDIFNKIPQLSVLNIKSTKLTRLPLAIAALTKLTFLDLTDSHSLVCTCQEQSLRPLIVSIGVDSVIGDCGVTSVYFFFETLSLDCPQMT